MPAIEESMMMRALSSTVLAVSLLIASGAAEARGLKIGVVNMQRAIAESDDGKRAQKELAKLKKGYEQQLNRKLKEFYAREQKLRKKWAILKDAERRKRAAASQKRFQQVRKEYLLAERRLMKRKTKVMLRISKKINRIIEKIARHNNYDYIFTNAAVLFAPRHVDVTNEVIRRYNK